MRPNATAAQASLPIRSGPVRFAVGAPDGLTSNAWRFWVSKYGDIYVACRDNFKEAKVSLHASGRWRMGFTTQALVKRPDLIPPGGDRAWDVWDEPPATLPGTVIALRLVFPTSELGVKPEERLPKQWAGVIHVEPAPPGKMVVVTLFVTQGERNLTHETSPSFCLSSLEISDGRHAQLVVHGESEQDFPDVMERAVAQARASAAEAKGIEIPPKAYAYFLARRNNGCRELFGAWVNRSHSRTDHDVAG